MRGLAAAPGHGHREQPAVQHRLLDLGDDLQVVGGPGQVERLREVASRRRSGTSRRHAPCVGVHGSDPPLGGDVPGEKGHLPVAAVGGVLDPLVAVAVAARIKLQRLFPQPLLVQPGAVLGQVEAFAVADLVPGLVLVAVDGVGLDDLAQRRRVEQCAMASATRSDRALSLPEPPVIQHVWYAPDHRPSPPLHLLQQTTRCRTRG